jgi:hypothetical protein
MASSAGHDSERAKGTQMGHNDRILQVVIQSPRGTREFAFDKTTKVAEVIEEARKAFGFEPGGFKLRREATGETLSPERPLVSFGIADAETLTLIPEMGSGV